MDRRFWWRQRETLTVYEAAALAAGDAWCQHGDWPGESHGVLMNVIMDALVAGKIAGCIEHYTDFGREWPDTSHSTVVQSSVRAWFAENNLPSSFFGAAEPEQPAKATAAPDASSVEASAEIAGEALRRAARADDDEPAAPAAEAIQQKDKPLTKRERATLLRLIALLAVQPGKDGKPCVPLLNPYAAAEALVGEAKAMGLEMSRDTIAGKLKEACSHLSQEWLDRKYGDPTVIRRVVRAPEFGGGSSEFRRSNPNSD